MDNVEVFYIDKFGRKVYTYCTVKEFTDIVTDLLELSLDKGLKVCYTVNNITEELDYYNIPRLI